MKVYLAITRMVQGGAANVVAALARGLDAQEFDVTVVTGSGDVGGLKAVVVPSLVRDPALGRDAAAVRELSKVFRGADVVHLHTSKAGFVGGLAARWAGARAIVYTPHGHIFAKDAKIPGVSDQPAHVRAAFYVLRRTAHKLAHRTVALSDVDRDEQLALKLDSAARYVVIPNGVDVERFAPRPKSDAVRRVVGIGRLVPEKGFSTLIEAMKELPGVDCAVAGEGPERLTGARFVGALADVRPLIADADVVAVPSLYESQGMAAIEAMAMARPVVASRVGGLPAVVVDGETGLLVPPGDPKALAAAIRSLLDDPGRARAMGERGRARVLERFRVERMVQDHATLYRSLCA